MMAGKEQETLFPLTFAEKKRLFLNEYKSANGTIRYKRYVGSPLRYAGGKSLAVGLIMELVPDDIERLVSPFLGGGSFEIACAKELGLPVIAYDIFDLLINYWDVQLRHPQELYERLKRFNPTREEYKRIRKILKLHWDGKERIRSKYDRAAIYYFNHNTSYGPHFLGSPSSVYLEPVRYKKMIEKSRDLKANIKVGCASFEKIMDKYKNDFLYCDPPYYLNGDSKMFVGMYPHRNFPIHHVNFKHEQLRDFLMEHEGGFVLSYNDCSTIRKWYKELKTISPSWQYTFGQGDTRLGKNRLNGNKSHIKESHELIIWKKPSRR
jgi:DNA adenine methylase